MPRPRGQIWSSFRLVGLTPLLGSRGDHSALHTVTAHQSPANVSGYKVSRICRFGLSSRWGGGGRLLLWKGACARVSVAEPHTQKLRHYYTEREMRAEAATFFGGLSRAISLHSTELSLTW